MTPAPTYISGGNTSDSAGAIAGIVIGMFAGMLLVLTVTLKLCHFLETREGPCCAGKRHKAAERKKAGRRKRLRSKPASSFSSSKQPSPTNASSVSGSTFGSSIHEAAVTGADGSRGAPAGSEPDLETVSFASHVPRGSVDVPSCVGGSFAEDAAECAALASREARPGPSSSLGGEQAAAVVAATAAEPRAAVVLADEARADPGVTRRDRRPSHGVVAERAARGDASQVSLA